MQELISPPAVAAHAAASQRWDCHVHPFGAPGQYPVSPLAAYATPQQPFTEYQQALQAAALQRCVLVQPSLYGDDNRALLDRLYQIGAAGDRGIIAPPADSSSAYLEHLHAMGVRGVRLNLLSPGGNKLESLLPLLDTMRALRWHVAAHLDATVPGLLDEVVARLQLPVVLDHMGRPPPGSDVGNPAPFGSLFRHMQQGSVYVKLSAPYQFSSTPPDYADVAPLALGLLRANTERVLFGSNWPHIGTSTSPGSITQLQALTHAWVQAAGADPALIFEHNPLRLYQ